MVGIWRLEFEQSDPENKRLATHIAFSVPPADWLLLFSSSLLDFSAPPFLSGPICASALLSEYFWCLASRWAPARLSPSSCGPSCYYRPSEMFLKKPHVHYFIPAVNIFCPIFSIKPKLLTNATILFWWVILTTVCPLLYLSFWVFLKTLSCQCVVIPACVLRLSSRQPVMPVIRRDQRSSW